MRSLDDLKRWKNYGFVLTPVAEDKSPGLKPKQKWKYDWSDETLLSADRLGVFHDPSSVFSIDFDDDDYVAHKYLQLLPDTFTDGKVINGHRVMTHRTYKANGQGAPSINGYPKYPKNISKKKIPPFVVNHIIVLHNCIQLPHQHFLILQVFLFFLLLIKWVLVFLGVPLKDLSGGKLSNNHNFLLLL